MEFTKWNNSTNGVKYFYNMNRKEEEKASNLYHHPAYKYNCAQAIIHKWTGDSSLVKKIEKFGSGRAPHGYCGALYAALELANSKREHNDILLKFEAKTGSASCREIRKLNLVSCRECVDIADKLVEENIKKSVLIKD